MPEETEYDPSPGVAVPLAPGLRRILAPNPSPMTFRGTNTYLLGEGDIAVIDPGPDDPRHLAAILAALAPGEHISHIFVTHGHRDHSALAARLAAAAGAPVLAFGPSTAGRSDLMACLARQGLAAGGEGVDDGFRPDIALADGASVATESWQIDAIWTPGHMSNHMVFRWGDRLFSGDLVMGWSTSIVSPPDGDMAAFLDSCRRLRGAGDRIFHPGHGAPVGDPQARLEELIGHRLQREAQICAALSERPQSVAELTQAIYPPLDPGLESAARRNVFAHLVDLCTRGLASADPHLSPVAAFRTSSTGSASYL